MIKTIEKTIKSLTPQQKIEILSSLLEKEKNKKNIAQIQTLIKEAIDEQDLIEKSIGELEERKRPEEEPLESIVEEAPELQTQEERKNNNIQNLYGLERIESKYLSTEEREKERYHPEQSTFSMQKFTEEERKKLKKQEEDSSRRQYQR